MIEEAKQYLESITKPLTRGGVEILHDKDELGHVFVVVPRVPTDYSALIGEKGAHAEAIRTMMRAWSGTNTNFQLYIDVMIPNSSMIKTQYV